jgi:hypothetical protein
MDRRTLSSLPAVALAIGLGGDYLFRASVPGIGATLWVVLFVTAVLALGGVRGAVPRTAAPWLAAAIVFAAFVSLRDTPELRAWNVLAVLGALFLSLLADRRFPLASSALEAHVRPAIRAVIGVLATPLAVMRPRRAATDSSGELLRRSLLAAVVTVPLLLLFGALLVQADPLFERLVRQVFAWDFEKAASHFFTIAILSWLAGGYLIASRTAGPAEASSDTNRRPLVGLLEVGVPMGAVSVLFVAFVAVQFRYLFGGAELIRTTVGLSVAEYARRGFFELVAASGLVIPLVVGADWLLSGNDRRTIRRFRLLAATQLVLVGLIMVSALGRLRLYYQSFGLTTDRVLALAVMVWIGLTLGWSAFTVLRGDRGRFPVGAIVGGLGVLAALNLINPEAVVARVNLNRYAAGALLDVAYLGQMSADVVPTVLARSVTMPAEERCPLAAALAERHGSASDGDWRTWNLSRRRARQALADHASTRQCDAWQSKD